MSNKVMTITCNCKLPLLAAGCDWAVDMMHLVSFLLGLLVASTAGARRYNICAYHEPSACVQVDHQAREATPQNLASLTYYKENITI